MNIVLNLALPNLLKNASPLLDEVFDD